MKRALLPILSALFPLAALSAFAGDAPSDKDALKDAIKKLADQPNYSFTSTLKSEGGMGGEGGKGGDGEKGGKGGKGGFANRPQLGPVDGKVEKDGCTWLSGKRGEDGLEAVRKGEKAAVKTKDGWKGADDLTGGGGAPTGGGGGGRFDPSAIFARLAKALRLPADDAGALLDKVKEIKKADDGSYAGDLTEDGAKEILARGRGQGGQGPEAAEPKGSAKFWVKDGMLSKYEFNVQGKMTFGQQGREVQINRTTTVEIKDAGTTKVEVPDEAKKLVE